MTESRFLDFAWLALLIATFAVPLSLDQWGRLTYATSLVMWGLPILVLWRAFWRITVDGRGRRRRALIGTVLFIVVPGLILDFLLGHQTLRFPGCAQPPPGSATYLVCLPAVGGRIPIEEVFFYAMGPAAMVLVYACCDEHWLVKYNPPDQLLNVRLVVLSPRLAFLAAAALASAVALWVWRGHFPTYYTFLVLGALLPAMFLYRQVAHFVNWPAFAVTSLCVIVTSLIWEVTLAIPRGWWGYEPTGMLGIWIDAWSAGPDRRFPIEAAFVWLGGSFSTVLSYEFAKAFTHHPGTTRDAILGPR